MKRLINFALSKFDLSLISNSKRMDLPSLIRRLKKSNIRIEVVYDIGAYQGNWTKALKSQLDKRTEFFLFEPNIALRQQLLDTGYPVFSVLLSDKNGHRKFYTSSGQGDSYYPEESMGNNQPFEMDLPCFALDDLYADKNNELKKPDLMKIDTQGSELDVLRGAQRIIDDLKILIVECPIVKYNLGAPTIQDYLDEIICMGFVPFQVVEVHILRNILVQIDIAFVSRAVFEGHFDKLDEIGFWKSTRRHYGLP